MAEFTTALLHALRMAFEMFAATAWSLVLGFLISAVLQAVVSREKVAAALGRGGVREVALATVAGAASSSCSYAAAAVSRTLFAKGAALGPAVAFLFASTNLVVELGIVLLLLLGWPFMAGEWVGGVLLVAILATLVRLTAPPRLVEEARRHAREATGGHAHHDHGEGGAAAGTIGEKLRRRDTWYAIAQNFVADGSMLWKDLLVGFLLAGALAAFVPAGVWQTLFVHGAKPLVQVPANALIGPLVAVLSFVCSIGNVPLAAVLWGSGVSFGGVLAFLFADLLVLPLLDVYRRSFGWKMAAYLAAVFYTAIVLAAIGMDALFSALGIVPQVRPGAMALAAHAASGVATIVLDVAFAGVAIALVAIARRAPAPAPVRHCCGDAEHTH